jgi:surfeit locus 1 family protein
VRDVGADMTSIVTARNVGLTALAAVLVVAMLWLGRWQYGAYDDHQSADAGAVLDRAPIPLDDALGPDAPFPSESVSQPVIVSGHYLPDEQFYVRRMGDDDSFGVATPVMTTSGAAIIVVRGAASSTPVDAPSGSVRVEGVLEPSQDAAVPLDHGRVTDGIQIARLVSSFDEDLYGGYVIATSSEPPDSLTPVPVPRPDASFWAGIRNLIYAVQWWLFAAFVVFMWWRIIRETGDRDDDQSVGADDAVSGARHPDGETV